MPGVYRLCWSKGAVGSQDPVEQNLMVRVGVVECDAGQRGTDGRDPSAGTGRLLAASVLARAA